MNLIGQLIRLRSLEIEDLDFLHDIENDESFWELSGTQSPFSKEILREYIQNAKQDISEAGQYRFVISSKEPNTPLGLIDLFDFNAQHLRAGVGIIVHPNHQNNGYGSEALSLLISYCKNELRIHQLYADVLENNTLSIRLFEKHGFQKAGIKKDWIYYHNCFKNEIILQLILEES
jgi:diamine N-acetyltransferase